MRPILFFIFIFFLGGFVLSAPSDVEDKGLDAALFVHNKSLNYSSGRIFTYPSGLSADCLKSIDREQLSAVIHPSIFIKTMPASGKDRSLGLFFCQQLFGFKASVVYPVFQTYLLSSKDFIAFKRILLYPKHSFW